MSISAGRFYHAGPLRADITLTMTLGILVSFAVDIGLVALLFCGSHKVSADPPPLSD